MPKVYIPKLGRSFDHEQIEQCFKEASKFGEVIVMLGRDDDVREPGECLAKLRRVMVDFTDEDYLLAMGTAHAMMWSAIVASSKVTSVLQTLQWDIKNNTYSVLRTPMEQTNASQTKGTEVLYRRRR